MYMMDSNLSSEEQAPSHVDETPDFRHEQQTVNTFVEAGLLGFTAPTLRGLVVQNPAQAKIYTKLHISLPYMETFQDVDTAKYLTAYLDDLFNHCLPPSTDPSPPLMWWDSIRYWLHGQTTIVIKKLIYSQARQVSRGLNAPLTIEVSMRKLFLFIDRQAFELNGSDLIITVESKDTQKNMLDSGGVRIYNHLNKLFVGNYVIFLIFPYRLPIRRRHTMLIILRIMSSGTGFMITTMFIVDQLLKTQTSIKGH